jgi:hypothetical protein
MPKVPEVMSPGVVEFEALALALLLIRLWYPGDVDDTFEKKLYWKLRIGICLKCEWRYFGQCELCAFHP